jgi:hypothetical protein
MFLDRDVRGRLIPAFLMMLSVTFGFWGVADLCRHGRRQGGPVGAVLFRGIRAPRHRHCHVRLYQPRLLADAIGRKPTAMVWYAMCLILTPVVHMWAQSIGGLLAAVTVFGFSRAGSGLGRQSGCPSFSRRGCVAPPSPSASTRRAESPAPVR